MISPIVSSFADSALLIPASLLLLAYLCVLRRWRLALALAVSIAASTGTILVLKLLFHACGHAITDANVVSPSGHVAFGAVFYGALAIMLASGHDRFVRIAAAIGTVLLLVAFGISRVRVGAHSVPEVVIGFMVGGAAIALFAVLHRWSGRPSVPALPLALGFAAAVALVGGSNFTLESDIARYAYKIANRLDVCEPSEEVPAAGRRFSSHRH
jgi:membrane-associated phospholipid phosphatase